MALSIKRPRTENLARELARRQKLPITDAIEGALVLAIEKEKRRLKRPGMREDIMAIVKRCSALPILDHRTDDEILGFDENGLPR